MSSPHTPILKISPAHLVHKVIRASAGSGKTHALSSRYLSLIAAGEQPSRILATTFTRAAAGEIRDRLLKRLADAITNEDRRSALAQSLGVQEITSAHALTMLKRLTASLHTLQIRTLDSFFASVVRTFSTELGLPPECVVLDEDDDRRLRQEALRFMLDESDPQPLIDLLRLLTRGDSDRGITSTIDRVIVNLYSTWREADDVAWTWLTPPTGLLSRGQLVDAIEALRTVEEPDDKRFTNAWLTNIESAELRDWRTFLSKGLAKTIVNGTCMYYRKAIAEHLITAYQPLITHAVAELVHRLHAQTLATQALIGLFHRQYDRLKHERRVLSYDDLTHALIGAGVGTHGRLGTLDDLGYRLDASIHHLLLDEFQDTSGAQWQALSGMALEVASQAPPERTFFCVGDVKQSIYGWRGANPDVLDSLHSILPGIVSEPLDMSYRSSKVVIDAVNQVFGTLATNKAMTGDRACEQAATVWTSEFHTHSVAEHLRDAVGYVQVQTMPVEVRDNSAVRTSKRLQAAAQLAAALYQRDCRLRIAILTRSNASVARLLFELAHMNGHVPASGRGGGPLIDAPPVTIILDMLQLADHPDDTIAAFNVAQSPLGKSIGIADHRDRSTRHALARDVRQQLLLGGYQRTIAHWVQLMAASCDARELRRLTQLVELAGAHDASRTGKVLRTDSFINTVENKHVPDVQPAPIEVMTVHQAKGLEFDAVILPELHGQLQGDHHPMMAIDRDDHDGRITRIVRYPNALVQSLIPELEEIVMRTHARTVRESLSLLYVAMTRAKHGLYMLIDSPPENEKETPHTFEGVIRGTWCADACLANEIVHEAGQKDWVEATSCNRPSVHPKARTLKHVPARMALATDGNDALRADAAASASGIREREDTRIRAASIREHLTLTDSEGRERGSVIHALYEQVEWIETFADTDDAALIKVTRRLLPRRDEPWHRKQVAAFRKSIAQPSVRKALSRMSCESDEVIVHREWRFARLVGGRLQSGSIDRLVLRLDAARQAIGAIIMDYKTDAIVEDSIEAQAQTHRAQLQMYREAVADVFSISERDITMQVILIGVGEVVTLKSL